MSLSVTTKPAIRNKTEQFRVRTAMPQKRNCFLRHWVVHHLCSYTQPICYHYNIICSCFDYGFMFNEIIIIHLHWFLRTFSESLLVEQSYRHCQHKRIDKILVFGKLNIYCNDYKIPTHKCASSRSLYNIIYNYYNHFFF
jgi:hypothetical protein